MSLSKATFLQQQENKTKNDNSVLFSLKYLQTKIVSPSPQRYSDCQVFCKAVEDCKHGKRRRYADNVFRNFWESQKFLNERTHVSAYGLLSSPCDKSIVFVSSRGTPCILYFPLAWGLRALLELSKLKAGLSLLARLEFILILTYANFIFWPLIELPPQI